MNAQTSRQSDECLSDFQFDRLVTNELQDIDRAHSQSHIRECERCATRLRGIEEAVEVFVRTAPPLPSQLVASPKSKLKWIVVATGLAAAAALLLLVVMTNQQSAHTLSFVEAGGGIRSKGGDDRLMVYIKRGATVKAAVTGDVVQTGDALAFTYSTEALRFLAVIGVDAANAVNVYYPSGPRAKQIAKGQDVSLPFGVSHR